MPHRRLKQTRKMFLTLMRVMENMALQMRTMASAMVEPQVTNLEKFKWMLVTNVAAWTCSRARLITVNLLVSSSREPWPRHQTTT